MKKEQVPFGELILLVGTRALLGAGVGMLVAERLSPTVRRTIGLTLIAVGVLSTVPLAIDLLSNNTANNESDGA